MRLAELREVVGGVVQGGPLGNGGAKAQPGRRIVDIAGVEVVRVRYVIVHSFHIVVFVNRLLGIEKRGGGAVFIVKRAGAWQQIHSQVRRDFRTHAHIR